MDGERRASLLPPAPRTGDAFSAVGVEDSSRVRPRFIPLAVTSVGAPPVAADADDALDGSAPRLGDVNAAATLDALMYACLMARRAKDSGAGASSGAGGGDANAAAVGAGGAAMTAAAGALSAAARLLLLEARVEGGGLGSAPPRNRRRPPAKKRVTGDISLSVGDG